MKARLNPFPTRALAKMARQICCCARARLAEQCRPTTMSTTIEGERLVRIYDLRNAKMIMVLDFPGICSLSKH